MQCSLGLLSILWMTFLSVAVETKPNFIVILADDLGYGDLQCYGHPSQESGAIDVMAKEGMRFTNWYSAASACTPSRAALLTGRLSVRTGMFGQYRSLEQIDSGGLPKNETTIAEALKELGYQTGMVGKWHMGINRDQPGDGLHLPMHHGFQQVKTNYPLSQRWECDPAKVTVEEMKSSCFKYQGKAISQQPLTFDTATADMVNDAKAFIQEHSEEPFFFYMPLLQTHSSVFCSKQFCGKSKRGRYGDSINEMSWAVGEVLDTLKQLQIDENTLVLFLSDNGPQLEMCTEGGQTGFLAGGKSSTWDGGIRVPAIARWPGIIPAGAVNHAIASTLDIYPTMLEFAGSTGAQGFGTIHDGKSIAAVLNNEEQSPHDFLFHYCSDRLMAVRCGNLKFHYYTQENLLDRTALCPNGKPERDVNLNQDCYGENVKSHDPPLIFNTDRDPEEMHPLNSTKYIEELEIVGAVVQNHVSSLTNAESQIGHTDTNLQPCCNPPSCVCNYPNASLQVARIDLFVILLSAMLCVLSFFRL